MRRDELCDRYFEWMCRLISDEKRFNASQYKMLLGYLYGRQFLCLLAMDGNRAADGIDLRYRFGYENSLEKAMITSFLDDRPCSVLEMLVALAIRCEEHIMDDPVIGNRTGVWFWNMISNLGLDNMSDSDFDVPYCDDIVTTFLNRKYKRNGEGGLFTVNNCKYDLRTEEIWYQMCWYLGSII